MAYETSNLCKVSGGISQRETQRKETELLALVHIKEQS